MRIEENSRPAAAPASASISQTLRPSLHAPVVRAGGYRRVVIRAVSVFLLSVAMAGAEPARAAGPPANVDANRIVKADQDPANWLTYGRTYSEQRYSPLAEISADHVKQLGLAWHAYLDTDRGQEATPLVIDGVLYVSTAWSMVKAYDAKTGALFGLTIHKCPARSGLEAAATWSAVASPLGRERSSLPYSTGG